MPPGIAALPLASFEIAVLVESNVPIKVAQVAPGQTSNVTLPLSFGSGSLNVAVSAGAAVFTRALPAGETSAGVDGAMFVVLFVTLTPDALAAGLPVGVAVSRTLTPAGWV
jgi:hypothetical protein